MPDAVAGTKYLDPEALLKLKNLGLAARLVVEGLFSGQHRSPHKGFSVEFAEHRQYAPGDEPRYLDWKLLAKRDRLYIKQYEEQTNLRCYLVVDASRSMGYRHTGAHHQTRICLLLRRVAGLSDAVATRCLRPADLRRAHCAKTFRRGRARGICTR